MNLMELLREMLCPKTNPMGEQLKECQANLNVTRNQKVDVERELLEYKTELERLKNQAQYVPPYKGNHTQAMITYKRHMLTAPNQTQFFEIDVRNFVTPNDFHIYNDLKQQDLFVKDPTKLDVIVPKIYQLAKKNYSYAYDDKQFGFGELWQFYWELRQMKILGKSGDCEDWSHTIGSYFACAGVPRDRWWISCGNVRIGGGHSTVYVKDDTGIWRHLNSTSTWYKYDTLQKYPTKDDEKDGIGIKPGGFWFSFNDYYSISDFATNSNGELNASKLKDKITVRPSQW